MQRTEIIALIYSSSETKGLFVEKFKDCASPRDFSVTMRERWRGAPVYLDTLMKNTVYLSCSPAMEQTSIWHSRFPN